MLLKDNRNNGKEHVCKIVHIHIVRHVDAMYTHI